MAAAAQFSKEFAAAGKSKGKGKGSGKSKGKSQLGAAALAGAAKAMGRSLLGAAGASGGGAASGGTTHGALEVSLPEPVWQSDCLEVSAERLLQLPITAIDLKPGQLKRDSPFVRALDAVYAGLMQTNRVPVGLRVAAEVWCNAIPSRMARHAIALVSWYDAEFGPMLVHRAYAEALPDLLRVASRSVEAETDKKGGHTPTAEAVSGADSDSPTGPAAPWQLELFRAMAWIGEPRAVEHAAGI